MSGIQPRAGRSRRSRRPAPARRGGRLRRGAIALGAAAIALLALSSSALAALSNPPAAGPIVFPMRDFVSADGYAPNTPLTFRLIRAGVQIGTAHGTTDATGLLEVNHPGGVCWEGSTPNIIAGDVVEVVTKEDPNAALEEGDALESLDVTAKPAELDGLDIVVHGTARDDAGNPLPLDHLEQRIRNKALLATTLAKQELRATSAPGAHGTLAYDPVDPVTNPRGTNWTARYKGFDANVRAAATDPANAQSRILAGPPAGAAGVFTTTWEHNEVNGPGMPECPPARDYSVTSVSKLNYNGVVNPLTRPANIVVSGVAAADTDSVDLTLSDGDPGTPDITRTGIVPTAGTGGQVWSASIPVGEVDFNSLSQTGLADGDVNVSASFNITPAGGTPTTIPGQPMTVAKDTVRPPAPVATPGEGSFKTSPISVSLDSPPDDTDTTAIRYRLGATPAATGEPTATSTLWNGTQIAIATTQTLKAKAFDALGNQSPTLAQTYTIDSTAPAAPGNLSLTPGDRRVDLVWDAATDNTGVVGYNVYRRLTSGTFGGPVNGGTPVTTTTFSNTGLTNGTTYVYAVTAVDAAGNESAKSVEDQATPNPVALAAPGLSPATAGDGKVDLSWTAVTGATSYNVYRATSATGTLTKVGSPTPATGTTFTDSTVTNGTTYFYVVRTVNSAGAESTNSNQVSATPTAPAPGAVTGLTATAGDTQVDLKWTAVTGATSYNVYRSTTSGTFTAADKVNVAPVTAASFTNSGLTNGTQYFYIVRAVNSGGESPDSAQVSATPKAAAAAAPTGVTATAGDAKVDLRWTAVTGATGYNVYRSTTAGTFGSTPVNANPVTAASFSDTGLTNGTKYFYVVRAVNAGGESASSAEVSATPVAPPPAAPTGLTATPGDAKVDLKWTAVTGATTYNVYRSTGGAALARIGSPTPATGTTFTDTTAVNGTTYTYAVRTVNANGESANSNTVTATPTAPAAPGTFTFAPAADVYVSQASPTTANNGAELQAVGGSTSAKQSFLRFAVSGLPAGSTVSSAKLRLFVTNDSTNGGVFNKITNTTFTESTTWNTKPAIDGPQVGTLGAVALSTSQEITLPAGTVTGNGTFSFAMQVPASVTNTLGYASNNNATVANRPQLVITTGAGTQPPPATVPAAPTGLAATAGNAQVGLSWNAVTGATGYNVYRSTTSGSFGTTPVNATPLTAASFTNTGLTNGTQYFFVVRAVNAQGQSVNSAQVTATPTAPPPAGTPPTAPTGVAATAGNAQVALSWTAVSGATGYNVYRSTTSGSFGTTPVNATPLTAASFTNTGLTNGTQYFFVVRAVNANGESANSTQVTATPTAPPATGGTFTFAPAADVYVSQASPTVASNGSELQAVGGSTSTKQSFLRFTVSGLPAGSTVSSAKLRLFVTNDSTNGGVFNTITNTTFTEATTWNTKPAIDGPQVGSLGAVALSTFQEITLPAGTVKGNGSIAFAMQVPAAVTNTLGYASNNNATVANRPQLVITT